MKKLLLLLVVLMLALAAGAWWFSPSRRESGEPTFSFAPAEHGSLVETVSATANLQPQEVIPVGTELAGKVVQVAADFNQVVSEGDLLLRLDDRAAVEKLNQAKTAIRLAKASVDQAKAQQDAAQKSVDRLRELSPNVSMRKDLDAAEAQLQAAKAAVVAAEARVQEAEDGQRLAELGLRLTRVEVPVMARSSESKVSPPGVGELAPPGTVPQTKRTFVVLDRKVELNQQVGPPLSAQLFLLGGDLTHMQAIAQVAEGDIGRVRRGQPAQFTVSTYGDDVMFAGKVADLRLLPTSDHGAIFYRVVIDVANRKDPTKDPTKGATTDDWLLRPGMTASVDIVARRHDNVWKVPVSAVNFQMPEEYQSEAARAKLKQWQGRKDADQWRVVWVQGADRKPWPEFLRLIANAGQEAGLHDSTFDEVLEWDPDIQPPPEPNNPPQFIIGAPPPKGGLFKLPPVKL
ncbi:MAG TPA: biotin/lipoyl-binding protein [Gemmataceae bacterium]|nr:biotin/lipoyl-binding protein [Gemmataceae bacterium]